MTSDTEPTRDTEPTWERRVIHLAAGGADADTAFVVAVCADGSIWFAYPDAADWRWTALPPIPPKETHDAP